MDEKNDGAGAGERDAGRAAADPRRPAHRGGRGPGPKLLPLRRRNLRALGHPALEQHTQRAYRQDVMDFVRFLGIRWPDESTRLFTVSVADVLAFRDRMLAESKAPKTINRRIASLSSLLQVPPGRRLRVPAAHHGSESGPRPVHPPGLVGPARRDEGAVCDPRPAAHGAPLRRHGVRLPGPGDHQVLPL